MQPLSWRLPDPRVWNEHRSNPQNTFFEEFVQCYKYTYICMYSIYVFIYIKDITHTFEPIVFIFDTYVYFRRTFKRESITQFENQSNQSLSDFRSIFYVMKLHAISVKFFYFQQKGQDRKKLN